MGKSRSMLTTRRPPPAPHQPAPADAAAAQAHLEACLAAPAAQPGGAAAEASPVPGPLRRYLLYFLHRLLDFRVPELSALAGLAGVPEPLVWEPPAGGADGADGSPFWYVHLPGEEAARTIAQRAVLVRGIFEIWGEGETFEEMAAAVEALPDAVKAPWMGPGVRFRLVLDSWGFKWSAEEQSQLWSKLEFLPLQGRVDLRAPDVAFWLCCQDTRNAHNGLPPLPTRWFLLRQVALADRSWVKRYALPARPYIGPTSMDPEVAALMANMARVRRGSLVLDPYVGTGSCLLAAGACGAHTVGADIDVRVLRPGSLPPGSAAAGGGGEGGGEGEGAPDLYSNFEHYGLPAPLGLLRLDVHTAPFRKGLEEVFDAILGDPPYGVRAGGRKSIRRDIVVRDAATHIPGTAPYTLTECLTDLLDMAARLLVVGGRLVFFMPTSPDTYSEDQVPSHPALELAHNTEQLLTSRYSRRLVTMVKARPYDAAAAAEAAAARDGWVMGIDRVPEVVYARAGPGGEGAPTRHKPRYRSKMM